MNLPLISEEPGISIAQSNSATENGGKVKQPLSALGGGSQERPRQDGLWDRDQVWLRRAQNYNDKQTCNLGIFELPCDNNWCGLLLLRILSVNVDITFCLRIQAVEIRLLESKLVSTFALVDDFYFKKSQLYENTVSSCSHSGVSGNSRLPYKFVVISQEFIRQKGIPAHPCFHSSN